MAEGAAGRRGAAPGKGALLCLAGFALYTAASWAGELVAGQYPMGLATWESRLAEAAALAALLACIVRHRQLEAFLARPQAGAAVLVLGALAAAGRASSIAAAVLAGAPGWLAPLGHVVYEASMPVLLLALLGACCRDEARWAPALFPAGCALAAAATLALRALPAAPVAVLACLMPLAAGAALAAHGRPAARKPDEGGAGEGAGAGADGPGPAEPADGEAPGVGGDSGDGGWTFPLRPVALMCVYAFVFSFSLHLSEGPNPYGMLGMLAVSLVALAPALARPGRYDPGFLYRMALPLMVTGLVCLAFLGEGRTVAVLFASSANVAFRLFLLIALTGLCHRYGVGPVWMFAIVELASRVAGTAGSVAGAAFTGAFAAGSPTYDLVMCCVVAGLVAVSSAFFSDGAAARSFGMVPTPAKGGAPNAGRVRESGGLPVGGGLRTGTGGEDAAVVGVPGAPARGAAATMSYSERVVWQCAQAGRLYALTLREQEVLELMVQGIPVAGIAERACISYGTVKTHVNHIYRKLGVHSREEAMALLQRETG